MLTIRISVLLHQGESVAGTACLRSRNGDPDGDPDGGLRYKLCGYVNSAMMGIM